MDKLARKSLFARAITQSEKLSGKQGAPGKGSILVVDDSRTQLFALNKVLSAAGYQVLIADNAVDGIQLAREMNPDLILMDIVMPGMNGFQATRELRASAETSHIPIIIISGSDQASDRIWGMRVGASDFLAKPVGRTALLGKVAHFRRQQVSRLSADHQQPGSL